MIARGLAAYTAAADDEALISRYRHVIDRQARLLARRVGDPNLVDDLWSAGALGLLDAAGRYEADRNVRFESFVEHRVRGAMLDELRRMDHLPRRLRTKTDQVARTRTRLAHDLGRDPESWEIAEAAELTVEEVESLQQVGQPLLPLDDVPMPKAPENPESVARRSEAAIRLAQAIAALPDRLQLVLSLYYVEGLTYREIGGILDVSEPRVCQLHGDAVKRLRHLLDPDA